QEKRCHIGCHLSPPKCNRQREARLDAGPAPLRALRFWGCEGSLVAQLCRARREYEARQELRLWWRQQTMRHSRHSLLPAGRNLSVSDIVRSTLVSVRRV